jgi:hypothetical protein
VIFALCSSAFAQTGGQAFLGRWDLTLTNAHGSWPQWMEIVEETGHLSGRIQPRGGAVRPIADAKLEGGHLRIVVSAAGRGPEVDWDLTAEAGKLAGVEKQGDTSDTKIAGLRAPKLDRPMPKAWTAPVPLFDGKDLTGWEPTVSGAGNHWAAKDGELVNEERGANLRTTRTFQDFKLRVEVNCPNELPDGKTQLCNSGIFLRGRDEIQVGTEGGRIPSHEMGALYGFIAPAKDMPLDAGKWQTFDITLVGRTLTVVRNGVTIHDKVEIPGITGGALDSDEGEPGPIFFQGDHDPGMRYRNITISLPK